MNTKSNNYKAFGALMKYLSVSLLTLFWMGGAKRPPTSFSIVTSTSVGLKPQNFLTFSFNPFTTLVQNFKVIPIASAKLMNWNQDQTSKKEVFLVKFL